MLKGIHSGHEPLFGGANTASIRLNPKLAGRPGRLCGGAGETLDTHARVPGRVSARCKDCGCAPNMLWHFRLRLQDCLLLRPELHLPWWAASTCALQAHCTHQTSYALATEAWAYACLGDAVEDVTVGATEVAVASCCGLSCTCLGGPPRRARRVTPRYALATEAGDPASCCSCSCLAAQRS